MSFASKAYPATPGNFSYPTNFVPDATTGNWKTQICKLWVDTARCRYGDDCEFAHDQSELTEAAKNAYGDTFKAKNCRVYFFEKKCELGSSCMFRHEFRGMTKLHRHVYTPQMWKFEMIFDRVFEETHNLDEIRSPDIRSLPVFAAIH